MVKPHGRRVYTKARRNRRRSASNGNISEDSQHLSSDSSESSDGGVLLRPSADDTSRNTAEITLNPNGDDDTANPSQPPSPSPSVCENGSGQKCILPRPNHGATPSLQLGERPDDLIENKSSSTSEGALEVLTVTSASRPASPDNTTPFQPIEPNNIASFGRPQNIASSATPNWIMLGRDGRPAAIGPNQQDHKHSTNTTGTTSNQTDPPRRAYVESAADSDEPAREYDIGSEQYMSAYDKTQSTSSSLTGRPLSFDESAGLDYDPFEDESGWEEESSTSRYHPSSSEGMNYTGPQSNHGRTSRPRTLRPRREDTPPGYQSHHPFAPKYPAPGYGPPPSSYHGYDPQRGADVPPYVPSVPVPGYEPPYNPYYGRYPDSHAPTRYPSYVQYQQGNPSYPTTNQNYSQPPPPPPSTIIPEPAIKPQPLDLSTNKPTSQQDPEHPFHSASAVKTTLPYKPPVSSDPSGHDISFQMSLKYSSTPNEQGKQKSVMFSTSEHWEIGGSSHRSYKQTGKSYLTRIQSLEYYVDRSSQDRITILPLQLPNVSAWHGTQELRWLHIQHDVPCLSHLRELIRGCQYLDEDLKSLTDSFLEVECAKFERKHASGSRHGYYIEPGTVLRCDVGYGQEPDRGAKSVFFCSVPYLELGQSGRPNDLAEEANMRIHPTRTLMESLYDYDLPDGRDSRQAILRCSSEQDSILYVPQIWYILCGSDILISYSRLSLDEIQGDSIKAQVESSRSLIATVTDLDNYQFSVALKTTYSYFSVRASIEALRSNAGGNTIHDYDLVLDNDEHLIAKNWLDIIDRDPLPSLKITLKFRSKADKQSLALIVREAHLQFAKKYCVADSSASDNDDKPQPSYAKQALTTRKLSSRQGGHSHSPSWSARRRHSDHAYALTSYMGVPEVDANNAVGSDNAAQYPEQFDGSYTPTLVGSLESQQGNDRRRIEDLEGRGMVINDISSVSNEPEVFLVTKKPLEAGTKPRVWDFLVDDWDVESHSANNPSNAKRDTGNQSATTPTAGPSSPTIMNGKPQEIKDSFIPKSPGFGQSYQAFKQPQNHHQRQHSIVPFFQWDGSKTSKNSIQGDVIVRQVLDQVHDRLLKSSEHFKRYAKSHISTLETLKEGKSPLHAMTDDEQIDKILTFRRKIAQERKNQLFHSSENLIRMFIPLNFDHNATQKIWGAIYKICQTLDSILGSKLSDSGDSYLVQDYTNDSDLIHSIALTQPEKSMKGCTRCSAVFAKLEDGIEHLIREHFYPDSNPVPESAYENLKPWIRTPDQVQLEARIHTFLTFMEECIDAFQRLAKVADDVHLGSHRAKDTEETRGYPVFESLVRVFEHITIILVFACDFMGKMERTVRKDHRKALNGNKFRAQFKISLHRIVQGAQKNLEQAKIDMILASRTESRPGVVTLASIGPEFIIAIISNGLFFRKLKGTRSNLASPDDDISVGGIDTGDIDVGEVYKMYANKLQLQVNQRPQKRLLPDIYALEEELDILHRLNQWQQKFCYDFISVLDPSSYKITTKSRFSHFRTENRYLMKILRRLEVRGNELRSLRKRTEKLRDQLQQNIEIEEESHGKAIRVFTFVTILFLPLSFVTSFFGMNTADIRNIDQDQRLFWIVSVPTTAFVIGIAYLYGYKWEHWKERLGQTHGPWFANPGTEHGAGIFRSISAKRYFRGPVNKDDLEKGVQRQETGLSVMSTDSAKEKARIPFRLFRKKNVQNLIGT